MIPKEGGTAAELSGRNREDCELRAAVVSEQFSAAPQGGHSARYEEKVS